MLLSLEIDANYGQAVRRHPEKPTTVRNKPLGRKQKKVKKKHGSNKN
jgi:hypothetical protein